MGQSLAAQDLPLTHWLYLLKLKNRFLHNGIGNFSLDNATYLFLMSRDIGERGRIRIMLGFAMLSSDQPRGLGVDE